MIGACPAAIRGDPRRFDPSLAEVDRVRSLLLGLRLCERVGPVDADDSGGSARAGGVDHLIDGVCRGHVIGVEADAVCLVTDVVDCAVDHGFAKDGFDLVGERCVLAQVDRLAAVLLHQLQAVLLVVADDDAGRSEEARRCCAATADRAGAGDVHG
ncbi:hypothetical protein ACFWAA_05905 [Streptomyces sp. NPDC059922]|uniref:hypothetical protein n=1 Tax=Streptomyces sp. NPDC059922 TaxID=3347005 RepID=UPI00364AE8C9